jgi:hypothetical protein
MDFADKSAIKAALDQTLISTGLGCVIGVGTAKRYSYIDFAFTNRDTAIPAASPSSRKAFEKRVDSAFFDENLGAEWVGICNDMPPPPIRLDE